jgi:hypothetical protein
MGHYYEGLLGIPAAVPAPDYYQLLGVEPGSIDEETVKSALVARLDHLAASPGSGSTLAQHLRRELQRARATLLDPDRRRAYDEQVHEQRREDVKRYVGTLVEDGVLRSTIERALLESMSAVGLSPAETQAAVDAALSELKASRRAEPHDEQRERQDEKRVLSVMHAVTDERLLSSVGVPGTLGAPGDEPEPSAASPAPSPPAESIWQDSSQIGTAVKRAPAGHSEEEAMRDERERRTARRTSRTWQGLFVVASTFVAASLVAHLAPDLAARIESATAERRGAFLSSPDAGRYAISAVASTALLVGLLVFLAGRPGRRGFLIPIVLLMLPAGYAGLLPGGQRRLALLERNALSSTTKELAAERDGALAQIDSARKVAAESSEKIAESERVRAEESAELTRKLENAMLGQQALTKKVEEESALARKAADQEPVLAERAAKIAELQKALKAEDALLQRLRAENDDLRKKVAAAPTR